MPLFVYLSTCLFVCPSVFCLFVCVYLSVCCLSICLCVSTSVCTLSVCPTVCLCVCLSISVCLLSDRPTVRTLVYCLYVSLFVCMSVCCMSVCPSSHICPHIIPHFTTYFSLQLNTKPSLSPSPPLSLFATHQFHLLISTSPTSPTPHDALKFHTNITNKTYKYLVHFLSFRLSPSNISFFAVTNFDFFADIRAEDVSE